jgi:hypothetical protein
MPSRLREWLARHDCELWESTPNGYCGYESIAVSLLLLQEDQKCGCVGIGYPTNKVIRARSLINGSIL